VLESTFTSAVDRGREFYPWLPVRLLMWDRYPVAARAPDVRSPVLVIHGRADDLIPPHHGAALARAFDAETYIIDGAGHNDVLFAGGHAYVDRLEAFTRSVLTSPGRP
jgi:pimeloyl-ACP methyl ester carboxylesterase